jgi:hypothetical protein
MTIQEAINQLYTTEDIELLKELWNNNYNELVAVLKEDSEQISQYSYEDILEYFLLLFNLQDEMQSYNFGSETNRIEAINILCITYKRI